MKFKQTQLLLLLLLCLTAGSVIAQDVTASEKWKFLIEPYMMFPNMKGETGVGNLPVTPVDASVDDIFSKLQFGAMLYFEAERDKWSITSDIIYNDLDQDITPTLVIKSGNVGAQQFSWEVAGLYKVLPWLDGGLGGRLNNFTIKSNIVQNTVGGGTTEKSQSLGKTWFDPILIVRFKNLPDNKFLYQFRGDLGGFGVGSDFTWQLQAFLGYRFSRLFQATAGYRIISIDYENGSDADHLLYDIDMFGPIIKLGFNF